MREELSALPITLTQYKSEQILDLSPKGITKVKGLEKLQVNEFIAFGNDQNDACLFEQAIHSVCVGQHEVGNRASEVIAK